MKLLGKNLVELKTAKVPIEIYNVFAKIMTNLDAVDRDFSGQLGGNPYMVETHEDLEIIKSDVLDICEILAGDEYVMAFIASNNAGGDTYFIPKDIWAHNARVKYWLQSAAEGL